MTTTRSPRRTRSGAVAFLVGSIAVHVGNYLFNLAAVRALDPAAYADVALAVTLLLFAGFITVGFQMATARTVAADHETEVAAAGIARWFSRRAFRMGLWGGAVVAGASPLLADVFRTASPLPFVAVGAALPWAFTTGVGRGLAQGSRRFGRLAVSFQAEMVVRLGLGVALLAAGFGVAGAVGALTASVAAAALVVRPRRGTTTAPKPEERHRIRTALWPSIALLVGEALVNHADTIVVKHAFDPTAAGQFAAIALLGRSVFFVTWPVSMLVFPIAARRAAEGRSTGRLLAAAVGAVGSIGASATLAAAVAPAAIVELVLGGDYIAEAGLLAPYVAATALFSCAATILSFRLAVGANGAGFAAAGAGVVTAGLLILVHPTLTAVVWIQVAAMTAYLAVAAAWAARREGSRA